MSELKLSFKNKNIPEAITLLFFKLEGKIEKTDWNVKEIEKKIEENKMGRGVRHDKVERVPKWSREQVGRGFEHR